MLSVSAIFVRISVISSSSSPCCPPSERLTKLPFLAQLRYRICKLSSRQLYCSSLVTPLQARQDQTAPKHQWVLFKPNKTTDWRSNGGGVLDSTFWLLRRRAGATTKATSNRQISDWAAYEFQTHRACGVNRFGFHLDPSVPDERQGGRASPHTGPSHHEREIDSRNPTNLNPSVIRCSPVSL